MYFMHAFLYTSKTIQQVSSIAGVLASGWVLFGITLLVCTIIVTLLVWMIIKLRSNTKKYVQLAYTELLCIKLLHLNRVTPPVNKPNFGVPELDHECISMDLLYRSNKQQMKMTKCAAYETHQHEHTDKYEQVTFTT